MTHYQINHLPNDICQCPDDGCPEKEPCFRWLCHKQGQGLLSFCPSLKPYDEPIGNPCPMRIPPQ